MTDKLEAFLSEHITLSSSDLDLIRGLELIIERKKGDILLRAGQYASQCYLVLKGCVRSYYIVNGEEKTTEFFVEKQPIIPVSYIQKRPSEYYLAAVEDCVLSCGNEQTSELVRQKIPHMEGLIRKFNEQLLVDSLIKFENFFTLSPQERYEKLMESRPDLCQRVPQYLLASYLGIKPPSLSRIRKRLSRGAKGS